MMGKGMRGGISQISHQYATADNDKTQTYQDANALYAWAMSQFLPLKNYKRVDPIDILEIPDDNPLGYILEVDIEYPKELHANMIIH